MGEGVRMLIATSEAPFSTSCVAISAPGVCERSGVAVLSRQRGDVRNPILTCRQNDDQRPPVVVDAGNVPRNRCLGLHPNPPDGVVCDDTQAKVAGVVFQIGDILVAREIFGFAARDRVVSETGMGAHGVQVKAIVASRPSTSERGILFKHHRVDPATLQGGGGGKAGRSGADNHDGGLRHRSLQAQSSATIVRSRVDNSSGG